MAGDIHHAVAHGGAYEDSDRGYDEDALERSGFGAYGRIEKIDGVVADTHREVEDGEQKEENDDAQKDSIHIANLCVSTTKLATGYFINVSLLLSSH